MFRIKRLYTFMLQTFLPQFLMTFLICLFIVLMQFVWKYIDDMVGKGLSFGVLAELFGYAALTMVPMALPLAILLASLMTFGNLGEHFELTALKASGISLLKTMRPLVLTIILVAIGAFFFQNDVLPIAQTKMWTLLYSMRQKSPELEIPEGVFYDQIPNYNLFVEKKDRETGMLYSMMIYDVSKGFENARIILADSGKMSVTEDKTHLFLKLWNGEQFENLREQTAGGRSKNVPYRRETFTVKEILVPFDDNFNRMDEAGMRNQYVGKNMAELLQTIDSVNQRVDSIGDIYSTLIKETPRIVSDKILQQFSYQDFLKRAEGSEPDSAAEAIPAYRIPSVATIEAINIDTVFAGNSPSNAKGIVTQALAKAKRNFQDYEFKSFAMEDDRKNIRRHEIELMKKFTLSFACIIFFFIGAPLGAIIRKGGLGVPIVISVFLFIFYYIFDNVGYKLARDGRWAVWAGMWLSSAILLPLGIFFTYKAVNDSAVFNPDAYKLFLKRLTGKMKRELQLKEFPMSEVMPLEGIAMLEEFNRELESLRLAYRSANPLKRMLMRIKSVAGIPEPEQRLSHIITYMADTRDIRLIQQLNSYPFVINYRKGIIDNVITTNNSIISLLKEDIDTSTDNG